MLRVDPFSLPVKRRKLTSFPNSLVLPKCYAFDQGLSLADGSEMLTTGLFTPPYTVNRFLPFALLLLNTSWPPFVAILARKP